MNTAWDLHQRFTIERAVCNRDVHWCQEDNSSENDDSDTLLMAAHFGNRLMEKLEERESENAQLLERLDNYRKRMRALEVENLKLSAVQGSQDSAWGNTTSRSQRTLTTPETTYASPPRQLSPEQLSVNMHSGGSSGRSRRSRRRFSHRESMRRFRIFKDRIDNKGETRSNQVEGRNASRMHSSSPVRSQTASEHTVTSSPLDGPHSPEKSPSRALLSHMEKDLRSLRRQLVDARTTTATAEDERDKSKRMLQNITKENENLCKEIEELRAIVKDQQETLRSMDNVASPRAMVGTSSLRVEMLQGEVKIK